MSLVILKKRLEVSYCY